MCSWHAIRLGRSRRRSSSSTCVEAVKVDPDGRIVIQSRNVRDLQIELPRLAQRTSVTLHRVVPLDDSLESVFGYLVDGGEQ